MRRSFGSRGGVFRQDVLAAADVGANSIDDDHAARIAHRRAQEYRDTEDGAAGTETNVGRVKGARETPYSIYRKTGRGNRRHSRNGGYHSLPKRPQRGALGANSVLVISTPGVSSFLPYSFISTESPVEA